MKLANKILNSVKKRTILYLRNSYLYRKYQFYKCRRTLGLSHHILFVCYGNICRSPFSEFYARDIFPNNVTISSCGLHDNVNRKSPDIAIKAALELNVDLIGHRSVQVTEDMVNKADIIFTFDDLHHDQLIKKYPWIKKYTFMISSLNMSLPRTIYDPYDGKYSDFINIYETIKISLKTLEKYLLK